MTTQETIIFKYKECIEKGLAFYDRFISKAQKEESRGIVFDLNGKVAGMYCAYNPNYPDTKHIFRVNLELAKLNLNDYLNDTIPHEVSHYLCQLIFPNAVGHHSYEWGIIMIECFNLTPNSRYDSSKIKIPGYHVYKCVCGKTIQVSPTIHNKIVAGQKRVTNCHRHLLTIKDYLGINESQEQYLERTGKC